MSRWDVLLVVSVGLILANVIGIGWFGSRYDPNPVLESPLNWFGLGLLLLFMGGAILGFYRGTWQPRTGGGGGTLLVWLLVVLAGGAILRGVLSALGI